MIRRLIPILGITFIDIVGFAMLIPLLPYFVKHFHSTDFTVGILFSTFALCQFISGPIWGNVSDRIGRKWVLVISQAGATVGWAMLAFAPNMFWVFIARIIEGTSGGNLGVTQAYVADLVTPKERARAFGLIGATFGAGMVLGPAGAGFLFERYGFAAPFLAAAGLQLITLILTITRLPESRSKSEEPSSVGLREIASTFHDPKLARILWQKLALSLALYSWFSVFALYLSHQLGFGVPETTYLFSAVAVLNVIVNGFILGRVSDRLGDRRMSTIGLLFMLAGFSIVPFVHSIPQLGILSVCFSFGMAFAQTGITAMISNAASDERQGTVLGVSSSLDSLSGIISPPISTAILWRFGSPWAAASAFLFAGVSLAMGLATGKKERAERPDLLPESDDVAPVLDAPLLGVSSVVGSEAEA